MPRGGRRQGRTGQAYGNRTDLNGSLPVQTAPGQPYGQAGQQAAAQKAVPMGTPTVPPPAAPQPGQPEPQYATPQDVPGLTDPTARPDEHLMTGAPSGPGPGPEMFPSAPDPVLRGLAILNSKT